MVPGHMWPNDKCVVNIAYPQAGFEWGSGDCLLLNMFHEQISDDGRKG